MSHSWLKWTYLNILFQHWTHLISHHSLTSYFVFPSLFSLLFTLTKLNPMDGVLGSIGCFSFSHIHLTNVIQLCVFNDSSILAMLNFLSPVWFWSWPTGQLCEQLFMWHPQLVSYKSIQKGNATCGVLSLPGPKPWSIRSESFLWAERNRALAKLLQFSLQHLRWLTFLILSPSSSQRLSGSFPARGTCSVGISNLPGRAGR